MDLVSRLWTVATRGRITPQEESLAQQGGRPDVEAAKRSGVSAGARNAVATTTVADRIGEDLLRRNLTPGEREHGGKLVHYSFGAAMGAVYGVGVEYVPSLRAQHGILYGLLLWAGAVPIALPLAGLSAPPGRYSGREHLFGICAHAVFGLVSEATRKQLSKKLT
jgi:hypothetical protein